MVEWPWHDSCYARARSSSPPFDPLKGLDSRLILRVAFDHRNQGAAPMKTLTPGDIMNHKDIGKLPMRERIRRIMQPNPMEKVIQSRLEIEAYNDEAKDVIERALDQA